MDSDFLDGVLDLEEKFYAEGHELGTQDGAKAGYNEGTVFGIEKGFDKFQEMGRLYGKGIVWARRLPGQHGLLLSSQKSTGGKGDDAQDTATATNTDEGRKKETATASHDVGNVESTPTTTADALSQLNLPNLPANPRLEKHLTTFLSLVDPTTLSMQNTEEDVADFDERLKKASAKARVIERIIGEYGEGDEGSGGGGGAGGSKGKSDNIEDIGPLPPRLSKDTF